MKQFYVPSRFTVGRAQGLSRPVMLALADAATKEDRDPREVAGDLIREGLKRLGYLKDQAASESVVAES